MPHPIGTLVAQLTVSANPHVHVRIAARLVLDGRESILVIPNDNLIQHGDDFYLEKARCAPCTRHATRRYCSPPRGAERRTR